MACAVTAFERTFAQWIGAERAFAFWKGRVALYAILKALGIGEDDARGDVEESVDVFDFHGLGGSSWRTVSAAGVR